MHIVYANTYFSNEWNCEGAGNYVKNIAHIMKQQGHTVEIITEGIEDAKEEVEGIPVHILGIEKIFKDFGKEMTVLKKIIKNFYRSYRYNRCIQEINKRNKIDIVQFTGCFNIIFFRNKKIAAVLRISEYYCLIRRANKEKLYIKENMLENENLDEKIQVHACKRADKIIAPSNLTSKAIGERINRQIEVIESPFWIEKSKMDYIDSFQEKTIRKDEYLLYYGLIAARKEAHIVVEIIPKVLEKYPNCKFVIVGKNKRIEFDDKRRTAIEILEETLPEKYKERCIYLGEIYDRERLFSLVANAYACVLPSRTDNLANTCIESMGFGKVVIGTDGTSAEQLITDGYNGFLCEIDNPASLFEKICEVMELSNEEREVIGQRAQKRLENMQPEIVYKKMMKVYESTIEANREGNKV